MKLEKRLHLLLLSLLIAPIQLFSLESEGQSTAFDRQLNERDEAPLREFVQSKENITIAQKKNNLEISGDIRFEWRYIREKGDVIRVANASSSSFSASSESSSNLYFCENYQNLRGSNGRALDLRGTPISHNDFDVESNLKFKYTHEKAWAAAHLQFDNSAGVRGNNDCETAMTVLGIGLDDNCSSSTSNEPRFVAIRNNRVGCKGSGDAGNISLKRAYMGYNIYADGKHRWDIEIGRRKMDDNFVSEVEFSSRFDGILLKYAADLGKSGDFYWNLGGFVIDERVNHLGIVTEFGFLDIFETGLDLRYSFIDWKRTGMNRCLVNNALGYNFRNSQLSFSYHFNPKLFGKTTPAEWYGGALVNHAAKRNIFTNNRKKNFAWYTGLYLGSVDRQGEWSFDVEYIYIQAQAVNDIDVGSIGRGNILDEHFYDIVYDPAGIVQGDTVVVFNKEGQILYMGDASESETFKSASSCNSSSDCKTVCAILPRRGNANFKGWRFEFLYAITDNFSLDTIFEFSSAEDAKIGGRHHYSDFEVEAIYAF